MKLQKLPDNWITLDRFIIVLLHGFFYKKGLCCGRQSTHTISAINFRTLRSNWECK